MDFINSAIEKAKAAVASVMPDISALDQRRLDNLAKRLRRTKGVPFRHAMHQRAEGDHIVYLHPTNGWRKRRAFI